MRTITLITTILFLNCLAGHWVLRAEDNIPSTYKPKPYAYYKIIEERNIFSPIPPKKPTPKRVKKPKAPPKPGLMFTGVVYNRSLKGYTAIIEDRITKEARFLKEGDKLGPLVLQKIEFDKIVVRQDDTTIKLTLGDLMPIKPTTAPVSKDRLPEKDIKRDSGKVIPSDLTDIIKKMREGRKKQESESNR